MRKNRYQPSGTIKRCQKRCGEDCGKVRRESGRAQKTPNKTMVAAKGVDGSIAGEKVDLTVRPLGSGPDGSFNPAGGDLKPTKPRPCTISRTLVNFLGKFKKRGTVLDGAAVVQSIVQIVGTEGLRRQGIRQGFASCVAFVIWGRCPRLNLWNLSWISKSANPN